MALASFLLVLGLSAVATAQCAYPALELLEFDYVNSSRPSRTGSGDRAPRNVCLTKPIRQTQDQEVRTSGIEYEFEGRLLVFHTFLRWLHLDAVAEAWTPLPPSSR